MTTKQQSNSNFNSFSSNNQNFQTLPGVSSIDNESLQSHSAPGSPIKLSPKFSLSPQGVGQTLSSSNYNPLMPLRVKTENNDNQSLGLFDVHIRTDTDFANDYALSQSAKKTNEGGNFKRLVDDMRSEKRSLSAEKSYKCTSPISRSVGLCSKENVPEGSDKSPFGLKKRQRNSIEQVNRSVGAESEKRKFKFARKDFDSDVEANYRYQTEEEVVEGLFDEDYYNKEAYLKELGPVRYSKMSEEDAATLFEIRRKELLSFLTKLGASSAVSKKKFVPKNAGSNKNEKGIRRLQDSLKENNSPTRFIIYNTAADPMWNNNASSQPGKNTTPAKEKKMSSALKVGCESAPDEKRRNSVKAFREREELSPLVERNLEASFNQTLEGGDVTEKKSPVKTLKKAEGGMRSNEEKIEAIESITIDLTKSSKLKKRKKAKKVKNSEEKPTVVEKPAITKHLSQDMSGNQTWEQSEVRVENNSNQGNLDIIKRKNQSVMNEIAEIESQIEKMKENDMSSGRYEDEYRKREERKRAANSESSQEGYLLAAKMKKNAERSRSMSLKLAIRENSKHNESMNENYNRVIQRNRENNYEEERGSQARSNQRVRFADEASASSKNTSQIAQKETKEKTLVRVPSQTNTTLKVDLSKQAKKSAPAQKRALSNNTNTSRSGEMSSILSTLSSPKGNTKDLKLKNFDIAKGNVGMNDSFNIRASQTTTNKTSEQNKLSTIFNGDRSKEGQQSKTKKITRTSETHSTLQTVRESLLTSKELTFSLRKTPIPSGKSETPVIKKGLPKCSISNKSLLNYKKPANKSISVKSSQKSVSDKDCSTDTIQVPNLFESSANVHEPVTPVPKISFSKEIKKILREGSRDEKPAVPPVVAKIKPTKAKETTKLVRDTSLKLKKTETNRPEFDMTSSGNIRAKIFRQTRLGQENLSFLKAGLSPQNLSDSSKLDMKSLGLEDFGVSPIVSQVKQLPFKKSETDKDLLRKGSLSTPRGFKVVTSPNPTTRGCLAISLHDVREKLAEKSYAEEGNDESLDSFRLQERSLNLPLQPVQGEKRNQNMKSQEAKDLQTLKRKKAAGYSLC